MGKVNYEVLIYKSLAHIWINILKNFKTIQDSWLTGQNYVMEIMYEIERVP